MALWISVGVVATFASLVLLGLLRKLVAHMVAEDFRAGPIALAGLSASALVLSVASTYYLLDRTTRLERQLEELSLRAEIISTARVSTSPRR